MRSIWAGAISFGLVVIPVKLYAATEQRDITFRQVHRKDGGRIQFRRVCTLDGEEIPYSEVAKGYELPTGDMVVLTDEDLAELPLVTAHRIEVLHFAPSGQVAHQRRELPGPVGGAQDSLLHSRWRRRGFRHRQPRGRLAEPADLFLTGIAVLQMALEVVPLRSGESVEDIASGEHVYIVGQSFHQFTSMQSRSLIIPSRIRVFTVPSATPSSSATSG